MAVLHFDDYPLDRNIFSLYPTDLEGSKFKDWDKNANYFVRVTIVLQIDTTNVSAKEYSICPNLTFLSTNQAIVNIYKTWSRNSVSFEEFEEYYSQREAALERYVQELVSRLNSARHSEGLPGNWYINYGLNERHIELHKPV